MYKSDLVASLCCRSLLYICFCSVLQRVIVSHHKVTLAMDSNSRAMKVMGSKALILLQGKTLYLVVFIESECCRLV